MRCLATLLCVFALPAWAEDPVTPITLVGPAGKPVEVRPEEGLPVLLHFWASWCPDCVGEIAGLQAAAGACRGDRLRVYAVNVGESAEVVASFVAEHGVRLPVLRDPKGRVWREVDGRGLPANLFWSAARRSTSVGPRDAAAWREWLAAHGCRASPSPQSPSPGALRPSMSTGSRKSESR